MLCSLVNRDLGFVCRSVVGFLDRTISRAMGCFFGCFRIRDGHHRHHHHGNRFRSNLYSESLPSKPPEMGIPQNRLSSLFLHEDIEDSPFKDGESLGNGSQKVVKELRDEAKFLKACGTLVETPAEIRQASSKFNVSPLYNVDLEPRNQNTSIKKLELENQPDPSPATISCTSNAINPNRISISSIDDSECRSISSSVKTLDNHMESNITSISPCLSATDVQCRSKSVRFQCDLDLSFSKGVSSEDSSQNIMKSDLSGNPSLAKFSPYPTPLKLSNEMQTPGTVFPANLENFPNGSRMRSQYVCPVMNPLENIPNWNIPKEEDSNFHLLSGELRESFDPLKKETPKVKVGHSETSSAKESQMEASLSSWLKPLPYSDNGNNQNMSAVSRLPHVGRTPADRPIIGMVAAHWNVDELNPVSPKWWDGNGIPNSTHKYREDQKVSWHATPFEERLEKALSEESFDCDRKHIFRSPVIFDENEESDTALSKMQSSSQTKSVVSF